mmetsp:Transcript_114151/g.179708  ORF Transcript_114151/g.179708 Transcript_114151/m.179708 type:complete len:230 (+) Transcript_114151:319-1008(+)
MTGHCSSIPAYLFSRVFFAALYCAFVRAGTDKSIKIALRTASFADRSALTIFLKTPTNFALNVSHAKLASSEAVSFAICHSSASSSFLFFNTKARSFAPCSKVLTTVPLGNREFQTSSPRASKLALSLAISAFFCASQSHHLLLFSLRSGWEHPSPGFTFSPSQQGPDGLTSLFWLSPPMWISSVPSSCLLSRFHVCVRRPSPRAITDSNPMSFVIAIKIAAKWSRVNK